MQIFDMHIHGRNTKPDPQFMLKEMEKAGIYGGCVFSNSPKENNPLKGSSYEERIKEVFGWTNGYEGRLFPILFINPYEDGIISKVEDAVGKGIDGFKMICTNYYVYEDACMKVLEKIASLNKPVLFHTGILWGGQVSSNYNRPLNFEHLLAIKNLRFSMGHCSWPWVDECIALYGKFLNALVTGTNSAEMFFDITPGTPPIYREELLRKLYFVGYDVPDNIMFGTDASAGTYRAQWAQKWLSLDGEILDKYKIPERLRQKMYHDNVLRFLGKTPTTFKHLSPVTDNSNTWTPDYVREEER